MASEISKDIETYWSNHGPNPATGPGPIGHTLRRTSLEVEPRSRKISWNHMEYPCCAGLMYETYLHIWVFELIMTDIYG